MKMLILFMALTGVHVWPALLNGPAEPPPPPAPYINPEPCLEPERLCAT